MTAGVKPSRRLGLDLASIRLALSIAEHRSLRRAASVIGISESALSHRLRTLEDVLTVSLFHRSSEGVEPTQAGLIFFDQAREALRVLDLAVANAGAISRGVAGRLTLGLYTSLSTGRLRDALAAYTAEHPEVDLQIVEGDRSQMVEGISSRAIDMAVLLGAPDDKLGEPMPLWRERLHVVLIADHPRALTLRGLMSKARIFLCLRGGPDPRPFSYWRRGLLAQVGVSLPGLILSAGRRRYPWWAWASASP
jgi:DNA-binding transcriptional LysR family regulator